jgi:hypothetical protein
MTNTNFNITNICRALLPFLIFINIDSYSQVPTVQDCAGAIQVCQYVYHDTTVYTGAGNVPNEIDTIHSCMSDKERNDVWYTFTAFSSGNVSFILTPDNTAGSGDDYDWEVFDITNKTCADIYYDTTTVISCNSYGLLYKFNGATGASTANGGIGNSNGPGENGLPWNADIPVTYGHIYVMMIANWSMSSNGYTLDFSPSTASILCFQGISDNFSENLIRFYPNPFSDELTIQTPCSSLLEIKNISGQIIRQIYTSQKITKIDLRKLPKGIYFLTTITDKTIITNKIIKI